VLACYLARATKRGVAFRHDLAEARLRDIRRLPSRAITSEPQMITVSGLGAAENRALVLREPSAPRATGIGYSEPH
jgi:hypothetical protein